MGFPRKEYWSGLPFPSPVDHILSELSTMTHLSWVTLHGMAHGFIEVEKAVVHVISLISFSDCGFHSLCPLRDKDKRLMEASWSERLTVGENGSCSDGQGHAQIRSDQSLSRCPTLCDPMNRSMPGLPVHHQLPEFTKTHIHRVSDAIQPSHPLSSPSPLAPNPSHHQSLFQWVNSSHEVAKGLEFQL